MSTLTLDLVAEKKEKFAELKAFVLANYKEKSVKEMALELGIGTMKVSNAYSRLVIEGFVEKKGGNTKQAKRLLTLESVNTKLDKLIEAVQETNTYNNSQGVEKQICRNKIVDKIQGSGTILSLPFFTCEIEKMILAKSETFDFVGVERDAKTYRAMTKTIKNDGLPIKPYHGEIKDKIYGVGRETYAHIILDYCGMLSTVNYEIEYCLREKLVPVGGTIHITFSKNLRISGGVHERVKSLSQTVTNSVDDLRESSEVAIRSYFDKVTGFDYRLDEIYFYRDVDTKTGNHKTPMVLVQITRIA